MSHTAQQGWTASEEQQTADKYGGVVDGQCFVGYAKIHYPDYGSFVSADIKSSAWKDFTAEVATLCSSKTRTSPPTTAPPAPPPPPPTVTYDLTGQGAVSVTLENASGGTEQFETSLPWHRDLGPSGTFGGVSGFVYVAAQLQSSGSVTCTIKKGDQVIQTATSTGAYVIATCSGSV